MEDDKWPVVGDATGAFTHLHAREMQLGVGPERERYDLKLRN